MSSINPSEAEVNHHVSTTPIAPISSVPPEVLIRIFLIFQALHDMEYYYRWTSILHVSQSWRYLVLDTSSLWGGIVQTESRVPSHWAIFSLQRSDSAELDINITTKSPTIATCDFILDVVSQIHRIRSLKLAISHFTSFTLEKQLQLLQFLESPAPCLEEADLDGGASNWYWGRETQQRTLAPIFAGTASRLRMLRLQSVPLSLKSFSCTTLVHLSLGSQDFSIHEVYLELLLSILRASPELESLELINWRPQTSASAPSIPTPPISLHSLRNLELSISPEACVTLLPHISIPPTVRVCLRRLLLDLQALEVQTILPAIMHSFGNELPPIGRLSITTEQDKRFTFNFWELDSAELEPRISFKLYSIVGPRWFLPCPPNFLSNLRYLYVSTSPASAAIGGQPMSIFSLIQSLSDIRIGWGFVPQFVEYLKQEPDSFVGLNSLSLHVPYVPDYVPEDLFSRLGQALDLRMQGPRGMLKSLRFLEFPHDAGSLPRSVESLKVKVTELHYG